MIFSMPFCRCSAVRFAFLYKLSFDKHISNLKANVCRKLSSQSKIHSSYRLILSFISLKHFLLPHFDYCDSLFAYFSKTLINKLHKLYNLCLFVLLRLELNNISCEEQQDILKPLNILPFKYRLLLRFSFFLHKIMYGEILNTLTYSACAALALGIFLLSHYCVHNVAESVFQYSYR